MKAFREHVGPHIHNKKVYNAYHGTTTTIDKNNLTPSHLQMLARNEEFNVTGAINAEKFYPGIDPSARLLIVRILRALVKCSVVSSVVDCHHFGGYPRDTDIRPRNGQIILIDQSGFQWQNDECNTGGLFFYPFQSNERFEEWRKICYKAFFGGAAPSRPASYDTSVYWSGKQGYLCEEQLKKGFMLEFTQALHCANEMAASHGKPAYFRFLKAGLGFFSSNLRPHNMLPLLRLQGILMALEAMPQSSYVKYLELPLSNDGGPELMKRIYNACQTLNITFMGSPIVDALAPVENENVILAVTNCADPHAAIGNEGGYSSVDAAIASNTQSQHMVIGARIHDAALSNVPNVTYRELPRRELWITQEEAR